ncbi:MAG: LCP family protein [Chloroflexota bacterium]
MNKQRLKTISLVLFLLIITVLIGSWSYKDSKGFGSQGASFSGSFSPPVSTEEAAIRSGDDEIPFILPTPNWDKNTRVTILVMGLDYRDWEAGAEASRSDTMIVLSMDPVTKTASVLSIPRDLWASIPGYKPAKINTAYYLGEAYKLPGGGPGLAMKTVEQTIGISIDYFAQIDFSAFVKFIDLIDGVKVDVPKRIKVHPIGGNQVTVYIDPGWQLLPGNLALAYARVRNEDGGDFARAERQQQVVLGIRDRILEPGNLKDLVIAAPQIYAELVKGINTNLSYDDELNLGLLAMQIKRGNINQGVINEKYVTFGRSANDLSILLPIPDKIRELRDELFGNLGVLSPYSKGAVRKLALASDTKIALRNGTASEALLTGTEKYLSKMGFNIVEISKADQPTAQTRIIDHTGNPYSSTYFLTLFDIPSRYLYHEFLPNYPIDLEIVLGSDWYYDNPLPK